MNSKRTKFTEVRKLAKERGIGWQKGTRTGTFYCYFKLPGDDINTNSRVFHASRIRNTVTGLYEDLFRKFPDATSLTHLR